MLTYSVANTDEDLRQILGLQQKNLAAALAPEELASQGFVTVRHSFDLLKSMNSPHPHIVAKDGENVVGYALVMGKGFATEIPALGPMFRQIGSIVYEGKLLQEVDYFVMGQICIEKAYRGKGVFNGLYQTMKARMSGGFPLVVTEVAVENQRSMNAHRRVGFKSIREYRHGDNSGWVVLAWDWK